VEDGERLPQVVLPQRVKIRIGINLGALRALAFPRVVAKLESLRADSLWLSEQLSTLVLTNRDLTTGQKAAADEHRYRTAIENVFRDGKFGAALRHLPSGYPEINRAWMWSALLAASIAGWLHQLTATPTSDGRVGHGT
jgi:hypothetical protein